MVISSITVVPQLFTTILMFFAHGEDISIAIALTISIVFLVSGLFFIILKYCLLKTDWIIDKLSLDKHFTEEKFDINIHRSTILSISIIVIGGLMLIESVPSLCQQVYTYVGKKRDFGSFGENPTTGWMIYFGVKTLIAYLLITNSRFVVNLIERQRKKNEKKVD